MIFKFSNFVIMLFISPFVMCQCSYLPQLLHDILKKLKNDHLCDIDIVYGLRLLDDHYENNWMMASILKETSFLMISLKISRIGLSNECKDCVKIVFLDSLSIEEKVLLLKKLESAHSKMILLTKKMSNTFEGINSDDVVIGSYNAEYAAFTRLPIVPDQNETVANWSWDEGLHGTLFPKNWIIPMNNSKQLTVLLRNDPPFVIVKSDLNGSKYAEGYLVDLWNCISERLNLNYEFKYHPTKEEDDFWKLDNNNLRVEAKRSEVDVTLFANADPIDFYYNYTGVHSGVLLQLCMYQPKNRFNYYQYIKKISPSCFGGLIFITVLTLLLLHIAGNDLVESSFYFLAISFNQGQGVLIPSYSVRIATISFSISVLIFFYVCTASMTSLSVSDEDYAPQPLEEVVLYARRRFITYLVRYSSAHVMMRHSNLKTSFYKLLVLGMYEQPLAKYALKGTSEMKHLSFMECERAWPYFEEFKCCVIEYNLQKVRPSMFSVRRNLSYVQAIRQESTRLMEYGIVSRLKNKWWPTIDRSRKVFIPVSYADVSNIYGLLIFGAALSLLLLIIERHVEAASL